jgi:hypothetical protein
LMNLRTEEDRLADQAEEKQWNRGVRQSMITEETNADFRAYRQRIRQEVAEDRDIFKRGLAERLEQREKQQVEDRAIISRHSQPSSSPPPPLASVVSSTSLSLTDTQQSPPPSTTDTQQSSPPLTVTETIPQSSSPSESRLVPQQSPPPSSATEESLIPSAVVTQPYVPSGKDEKVEERDEEEVQDVSAMEVEGPSSPLGGMEGGASDETALITMDDAARLLVAAATTASSSSSSESGSISRRLRERRIRSRLGRSGLGTEEEKQSAAEDARAEAETRRRRAESRQSFSVEEVLDVRENRGDLEYLIKWVGHPSSSNTWEPFFSIGHMREVQEYWWLQGQMVDTEISGLRDKIRALEQLAQDQQRQLESARSELKAMGGPGQGASGGAEDTPARSFRLGDLI